MLQTLTFAGPRLINAAASFFRYESGSAGGADESIRVRADGADLGLYFPGDALELPQACSTWEISPTSGACAGIVRLGVGRVQSARLVGVVSVVDKSSAVTMSDAQFSGTYSVAATAGLGSLIALAASGGSGKRLAVRSLMASSAVAGRALVFAGQAGGTVAPTAQLRSKYMQAAGQTLSGQARANAYNTAAGTPSGAELSGVASWYGAYLPPSTPVQLIQGPPIVIEPGRILAVSAEVLNRDLSCWFEVEEV